MERAEKIAIEIAREITTSAVSGAQISFSQADAKKIADFFDEVYKNVLITAKEAVN